MVLDFSYGFFGLTPLVSTCGVFSLRTKKPPGKEAF